MVLCGTAIKSYGQNISQTTQTTSLIAQQKIAAGNGLFGVSTSFIENKGQYGTTFKGQETMGKILFGFEGHDMPILFTKNGIIFLQRKVESISYKEREKLEKQGVSEEEIEHKKTVTDRAITMEWLGANENVEIVKEEKTYDYHTYGLIQEKAYGYKKIIYKNLYNGIDLVYSFTNGSKIGFEYSLQVAAGANISKIKMQYGGDVKKIKLNKQGNLIIDSDIEGIEQSIPITYYAETENLATKIKLATSYSITRNAVNFLLTEGYDKSKPIIIDPFVSSTNNLDGLNAGKAKDIDFDYEGNVYVTGGGSTTNHRLAKYNAVGILQWTFNGILTSPVWQFGVRNGGWVVDKLNGNIYLGQAKTANGFIIIRLNSTGLFDNFYSDPEVTFNENWKMTWNCNSGNPQILIGGGSTNSNINLGILSPPSAILNMRNITEIPVIPPNSGTGQDVVDIIVDPTIGKMYTIFASILEPFVNNRIFCNDNINATVFWSSPTGYTSLFEGSNRPYLSIGDNSANILAQNPTYLFYWDGKNLKAFDKNTGAVAGSIFYTNNTERMSGGILADPLNNIYIGNTNGTITSYTFDGTSFNANGINGDPTLPEDIPINGFSTKSVYDLAYNEAAGKLYACGDGFVASYDAAVFGSTTTYSLNITTNCATSTATSILSPLPPIGSLITYTLFNGASQITSNTTGIFTSIIPLTNYTIVATLNAACSGTQTTKNFIINAPTIATTFTNEICGNATGQIAAIASGTVIPYSYSINGVNFFPSGTFTGLAANSYTVTVKDGNGCINTKQVVVGNNSFTPTFVTTYSGTTCGNSTGAIDATPNGGVGPYQYSINNGVGYQSSNIFSGLAAGQYQLKIKDVNGCLSTTVLVNITPSFGVGITALSTNSTCGLANGKITATPIGGASPFQYSINSGTTYQSSNIFTGLIAGPYIIKIKDANTCTNTTAIISVANTAGAAVTATSQNSTCGNSNGIITATRIGGTTNFEFSNDNGLTYQAGNNNVFTNLSASASPYKIKVKDGNNCISPAFDIVVSNTAGATVTAISQNSTCGNANGIITATRIGGTPNFQYSNDNGTTYQTVNNNIFSNLLASVIPYKIKVKDGNNCISPAFEVLVSNTPGATVTATVDSSTCGIANGKITATRIGGTPNFEYSNDNGLTYQAGNNNVFTNLSASANPYKIKVRDGNNCVSPEVEIFISNKPSATVTATSTNATCGYLNGKISAIPNGQYPPFVYSINGGISYQSTPNFTNLAPILYTIFIKDNNNCVTSSPIVVAATPVPMLNVFAGSDTEVVIKQPLQLNAIDVNGIGFVSYAWSPSFGLNRPDIKNPISILEKDYAYELIATTADGCLAKDSIKIKISLKSEIYVPSGFTPNGDGLNDVLRPKLIGIKTLKYFAIYNRYGELIYKSTKEDEGWDGKIKGLKQPIGTFVWIAEGLDYKDQTVFRKGTTVLIQ